MTPTVPLPLPPLSVWRGSAMVPMVRGVAVLARPPQCVSAAAVAMVRDTAIGEQEQNKCHFGDVNSNISFRSRKKRSPRVW
jgi:hypothetical protein